jgi:hypothetical protein
MKPLNPLDDNKKTIQKNEDNSSNRGNGIRWWRWTIITLHTKIFGKGAGKNQR